MHIESVQAIYPSYANIPASWRTDLWQIVVKVETDIGVIGYGCGGGGKASLPIVNTHFNELLTGETLDEPSDLARIWDRLYFESIPYGRKGIAMMALSGVDLALWDAFAKAQQAPVAEVIGGLKKQQISVYATGSDSHWYAEQGVIAQKLTHHWTGSRADYDSAVNSARSARSIMGDDALIMFDVYMSWNSAVAIEMAQRLQEFDIYWFEDVLTPDDLEELGELRSEVAPINLAGGEHEFGFSGFNDIARAGAYDIWQPDITWCGGITAGLRICDLAKEHGAEVIPHRGGEPWGLHLIAASDICTDLAEMVVGTRGAAPEQIWLGSPAIQEGKLSISDNPGFGVSPNESML